MTTDDSAFDKRDMAADAWSRSEDSKPTTVGKGVKYKEDPLQFDPDFKGPIDSRSCTDIFCLVIFVAFLIGWFVVAGFAIYYGDPGRLLSPTDSKGQVCGRDEGVRDKKYLFFFDITRCASPKVPFTGCPTTQICVDKCPTENWFGSDSSDKAKLLCHYNADLDSGSINSLIQSQQCAPYYVKSQSIARRCIPVIGGNGTLSTSDGISLKTLDSEPITVLKLLESVRKLGSFLKARKMAEGVVEDIRNVWPFILVGCGIAMGISLLWICLLRVIAKFMVWFSLIAFTILFGFGSYYTMNKYLTLREEMKASGETETEMAFEDEFGTSTELEYAWLALFLITVTVFVVCLIMFIFLRKRILLAIALIHEASKAVGSIMSTLFFPIIPNLLQLVFIVFFCIVLVLLASGGRAYYRVVCNGDCSCSPLKENSTCNPADFSAPNCAQDQVSCQFYAYGKDAFFTWLHVYNAVGLFWVLFFLSAFEEMVLAGAFATWYWAFRKPEDVPPNPLLKSVRRTLRCHLGTLAFGSLIIAIVRMIRVGFEYLSHKLKQNTENKFVKALLCCCRCCLWCVESFLMFINRNAYVYCAIYGTNFCTSAKNSFSLIMRNALRVVVLDKVTDFLMLIGELVVTGLMALVSFFMFSGEIPFLEDLLPRMNYYMTPVVIITASSFFIASSFFDVYNMAVDTLFLCFLEDTERNDGSEAQPYFMSKDLKELLEDKENNKDNEGKDDE